MILSKHPEPFYRLYTRRGSDNNTHILARLGGALGCDFGRAGGTQKPNTGELLCAIWSFFSSSLVRPKRTHALRVAATRTFGISQAQGGFGLTQAQVGFDN